MKKNVGQHIFTLFIVLLTLTLLIGAFDFVSRASALTQVEPEQSVAVKDACTELDKIASDKCFSCKEGTEADLTERMQACVMGCVSLCIPKGYGSDAFYECLGYLSGKCKLVCKKVTKVEKIDGAY